MQATYVTADGVEVSVALADVDARRVLVGLPVRSFPVYRGRKNYSGYFWSATTGGHVVYESLLELSWLWLADFDRSVSKIAAQPMRWRGDDASRVRNRIPDFLCQLTDGSVRVVDVKPASMLPRPEVTASLSWTKEVCVARGWDYDVWTGPNPVKLRNVQWVAAARLPHVQDSIDVGETVHAGRLVEQFFSCALPVTARDGRAVVPPPACSVPRRCHRATVRPVATVTLLMAGQ